MVMVLIRWSLAAFSDRETLATHNCVQRSTCHRHNQRADYKSSLVPSFR